MVCNTSFPAKFENVQDAEATIKAALAYIAENESLKMSEVDEGLTRAVAVYADRKAVSFVDTYRMIEAVLGIRRKPDWPLVMAYALKVLGLKADEASRCIPSKTGSGCIKTQHYRRLMSKEYSSSPERRLVYAYSTNGEALRLVKHAEDMVYLAWLQYTTEQKRAVWNEAPYILHKYDLIDQVHVNTPPGGKFLYIWHKPGCYDLHPKAPLQY